MDNNKSQYDPKGKAVASFVLGITSIIGGIITIYMYSYGGIPEWAPSDGSILIYYLLIPIVALMRSSTCGQLRAPCSLSMIITCHAPVFSPTMAKCSCMSALGMLFHNANICLPALMRSNA